MIAKLTGTVDHVSDTFAIVDVNGVGYKVFCSNKTLSQLPPKGEACKLYIETIVREDAFMLYGFKDAVEQDWFNLLTTVQGVGARVGLAILSVAEGNELSLAIASQDKAYVARADGVGPKLATRIVTELKDKVGAFGDASVSVSSTPSAPANSNMEDAVSALTNLGYKRMEALQAIQKASKDQDNAPVDILIRDGLKVLSGG